MPIRHTVTALAVSLTMGVALWVSRASLDRYEGPHGPIRVAMLPAWPELVGLVLLVLVIGMLLVAALDRWHRRHAGGEQHARLVAVDACLPLFATALLILPYLPYLPDWLPIMSVLAGPARYLLWFVVVAQVASALVAARAATALATPYAGTATRILRTRFVMPILIVVTGMLVFSTAALRLTGSVLFPGGDEPHYLVIAQSIWRDHDLKIENNHKRADYDEYFSGTLAPHFQKRGSDREIYSIHPIGLPVLLSPVYALRGYRGVVLFLVLAGAIAATLMWRWARRLTRSAGAATFAWAAVALSAPFVFSSFTVYPEVAGALCVMIAFTHLARDRPLRALVQGLAIAALPWLSTKYSPMAATLAFVCALRAWHYGSNSSQRVRLATMAAVLVPFGLSLVGWFVFFDAFWGTPWPTAPYGGTDQMQLDYLRSGAFGLLFDQEYGLVPYAPVLILGFTGLAAMWRTGASARVFAVEIAVTLVALLATVGAYHIWWGGAAAPGRPMASGLLLLGAPIAWQYAHQTSAARRAAYHLLLFVGLGLSATMVFVREGFLVANGRDGISELLEWLSPEWHLWALWPSFVSQDVRTAAGLCLVWLTLATLCSRWLRVLDPRVDKPGRAALAATCGAAVVVLLASAAIPLFLRKSLPPSPRLEARSRIAMLDKFDSIRRPLAIVYDPFGRIDPSQLPSHMTLVASPGLRQAPQPVPLLFNARFALPAGNYVVELRAAPSGPRAADAYLSGTALLQGELALQVGRIGPPRPAWRVDSGNITSWRQAFSLPADVNFVGFRATPELRASATELRLRPVSVVDRHLRPSVPPVLGSIQYGSTIIFFHDEQAWPEQNGFWTRGESTTLITLTTTSDHGVSIRIRSGDRPNIVTLETQSWRERITLEPQVARDTTVPSAGRGGVVTLKITSVSGFRPADTQPGNTDRRLLGSWIEVTEGIRRDR